MIDSLHTEFIKIGSSAITKDALLEEIADFAGKSPVLNQLGSAEIADALKSREALASTGLAKGIAIPHCSFSGLKSFIVGLIAVKEGIEFDALDKNKSTLVFFIIGPAERRNKHIKILSSISRLANDEKLMKQLHSAESAEDISSLLTRGKELDDFVTPQKRCQMLIHIQKEDLFQSVLEILSSEVEGSVSVLDSSAASSYLYRLPLFSSFWNEETKLFSKIIIAVLEKPFVNDCIRRINMVRPEDGQGILITVTDLLYADGSLDF